MDLKTLTIKKFHDGLLAKKFSALEVAQAFLAEIKKKDEEIGAYLSVAEVSAVEEAGDRSIENFRALRGQL